MTLTKQIDDDLKQAMRDKDSVKLGVLRLLKSALRYAAIDKGQEESLPDDEAIQVIRKEVKKRQDSIEGYQKAGREELAAKEKAEQDILETYLPKALTMLELQDLVAAAISEAGATSKSEMGKVMKIAQEKSAGRADGKSLSKEVMRQLTN